MRALVIVAVSASVGLVQSAAWASPPFPNAVQSHLGLTYSPPCSLCHAGGVTGLGTVTTPFGKAMRARGLVARSVSSLDTALDRMAADRVDSNGDGATDIDELRKGTDPNANAPGAAPPPEFGCKASPGRPGDPSSAGSVGLLAGAAWLVRARRKRGRGQPEGSQALLDKS